MSNIKVTTVTAPSYWASYLINGDASGMDDEEIKLADEWQAGQEPWYVVDVARDGDGEPQEAWFTWSYSLHGGNAQGGDVLKYVMHKLIETE